MSHELQPGALVEAMAEGWYPAEPGASVHVAQGEWAIMPDVQSSWDTPADTSWATARVLLPAPQSYATADELWAALKATFEHQYPQRFYDHVQWFGQTGRIAFRHTGREITVTYQPLRYREPDLAWDCELDMGPVRLVEGYEAALIDDLEKTLAARTYLQGCAHLFAAAPEVAR